MQLDRIQARSYTSRDPLGNPGQVRPSRDPLGTTALCAVSGQALALAGRPTDTRSRGRGSPTRVDLNNPETLLSIEGIHRAGGFQPPPPGGPALRRRQRPSAAGESFATGGGARCASLYVQQFCTRSLQVAEHWLYQAYLCMAAQAPCLNCVPSSSCLLPVPLPAPHARMLLHRAPRRLDQCWAAAAKAAVAATRGSGGCL